MSVAAKTPPAAPRALHRGRTPRAEEVEPDAAADSEDVVGGQFVILDEIEPGEPDEDVQAALDEEPCVKTTRPVKPKYKPGTRHEVAARERATEAGSWWMRPDADFGREAQRMREQPTRLKVPGEDNVVGWSA